MIVKNRFLRRLLSVCWYSLAVLLVLAALLMTLARIILPYAEEYRAEVEQVISKRVGLPVTVGTMTATWRGFTPYLELTDINLLDAQQADSLLHFGSASIGLDMWRSMRSRQVVLASLTVRELRLYLTRYEDGHIEVHGFTPAAGETASAGSQEIANWLFGQPDIGIEDSELVWTDRAAGHEQLRFSNVRLHLRNDQQRHQLEGQVRLPEDFGRTVRVALDIEGDMLRPRDWTGSLFVDASGLRPQAWLGPLQVGDLRLEGSELDFELWTEWQKSHLRRLEGSIDARELDLVLNENVSPLREVKAEIDWSRQAEGWQMRLNEIRINAGADWPETRMLVTRRAGVDYDIQLGFVRLQHIIPVLQAGGAFADNSERIKALAPRGDISDIHLRYVDERQAGQQLASAAARFTGFGVDPLDEYNVPGIDNLDGHISGTAEQGEFIIDSRSVSFSYPGIFRETLGFDELRGKFSWQRSAGDLLLHGDELLVDNEDLRSEGYLTLELPDNGNSPFMDLVLEFEGKRGDHASRYYPLRFMSEKAVAWLDRAIINGRVPHGGAVMRGPLHAFPFHNNEGRFEVSFRVEEGELDYVPGWPAITGIGADILFDGPAMHIHADQGRIYSSRIDQADVRIRELDAKPLLLDIKGQTYGSTQDALRYMVDTGIAGAHASALKRLQVEGKTRVALDAVIPLKKGEEKGYTRGYFTLEQASLALQDSAQKIDRINGQVNFLDDDYQAENIKARMLGENVSINIASHLPAAPFMPAAALSIQARGKMPLNQRLNAAFKLDLPEIIEGEDDWQLGLRIPENIDDRVLWTIHSDLEHSVVSLPEPLLKASGEKRALTLQGTLAEDVPLQVRMNYGDTLNAVVQLDRQDPLALQSGEIHFGDIPPSLPDEPGLHITGTVPRLPVDAWLNWYETRTAAAPADAAAVRDLEWLRDIDVTIAELDMYGHGARNVRLDVRREAEAWKLTAESERVTGSMYLPYQSGALPVRLDLQHLKLPRLEQQLRKSDIDPRSLPALELAIGQFVYGDTDYGQLDMKLVPQLQGSFIEKLYMNAPFMRVDASGDWQVNEQGTAQT
ncbi:MAG: YhdP family protein, partial [Granulosicoccaceae bacterium]